MSRMRKYMKPKCNFKIRQFVLLLIIIPSGILATSLKQSVEGSLQGKAERYFIRVSGCDDGGKAYLNNQLIVDVGFDEDSNWLDITEDVAQGKDKIRFVAINKTGAITYVFQVKRNDTIVFEQSCGKAKIIGCENNRAFRVGKARKFTFKIRKD